MKRSRRVGRIVRQPEQQSDLVLDRAAGGTELAVGRGAELLLVVVERAELAPLAHAAIHLDAGLEYLAQAVAVLPPVLHLEVGTAFERLLEHQVHPRLVAAEVLLREQRELDRVRAFVLERVGVLGEQAEVGPVLALLGELEDVLPCDLGRVEVLARLALVLHQQLGPPAGHWRPLDFRLVCLAAVEILVAVEVVVSAQLDGDFAFLDQRRVDDMVGASLRRVRAGRDGEQQRRHAQRLAAVSPTAGSPRARARRCRRMFPGTR